METIQFHFFSVHKTIKRIVAYFASKKKICETTTNFFTVLDLSRKIKSHVKNNKKTLI